MTNRATPIPTAPDWLSRAEAGERFDVRPLLESGIDPLGEVLSVTAGIAPGGSLVIDAPFNPVPLRRLLAVQGFSSHGIELARGHWRIYLFRDGEGSGADQESDADCAGTDRGTWREADGIHLDVRGLTPPQPMLAILRLLATLGHDATVIVHHDRDPVYLVPELAERGWQLEHLPADGGEILLRLTRTARR